MLAKLLLSAVLPLLGAWATAAHAERITWLMAEFALPEGQGAKGPARKGIAEPLVAHLRQHWPEPAEHVTVLANVKRSWMMIEAGEHVCHMQMLRTPEREAKAVFHITHLVPPAQLITRAELLPRLPRNAQGEVLLSPLMREGRLFGALIEGRQFGAALDHQLAQRPPQAISLYGPVEFGTRLMQMVAAGRADYTIEYDFTLAVQREQLPALQSLVALPVQGASDMVQTGVACPRTDWGRATIAKVAQILSRREALNMMNKEMAAWLSPSARQTYGARMDAFHAERMRNAPP